MVPPVMPGNGTYPGPPGSLVVHGPLEQELHLHTVLGQRVVVKLLEAEQIGCEPLRKVFWKKTAQQVMTMATYGNSPNIGGCLDMLFFVFQNLHFSPFFRKEHLQISCRFFFRCWSRRELWILEKYQATWWLAQQLRSILLEFNGDSYGVSYEPGSKLLVLGMVIQRLIGNPFNGYINPYYWVDDHPLLYGNNGSLDPIAHMEDSYGNSTGIGIGIVCLSFSNYR